MKFIKGKLPLNLEKELLKMVPFHTELGKGIEIYLERYGKEVISQCRNASYVIDPVIWCAFKYVDDIGIDPFSAEFTQALLDLARIKEYGLMACITYTAKVIEKSIE